MAKNRNKANGSRYEREFVQLCQDAGLVAYKVPLSGALSGFPGDVVVSDETVIECKYRKDGGGFKRLLERVHETDALCVEVAGLRAMRLNNWLAFELLRLRTDGEALKGGLLDGYIDRPKWTSKFTFIHNAFDQGECAADFVACRMPRMPWMMVQRTDK